MVIESVGIKIPRNPNKSTVPRESTTEYPTKIKLTQIQKKRVHHQYSDLVALALKLK
jgi:hypothetical protein|tara:strand:- start:467 stop:637 length:171 start_codon:yes stop_codon:yes gene_type:complete